MNERKGLLTQLPKDIDKLADFMLDERARLTLKLEETRVNNDALDQLEQAINAIGRYEQQNGRVDLTETKIALEEALKEHLKQAAASMSAPILEDAIAVLQSQEIQLGRFSDLWRGGTRKDLAMLAMSLRDSEGKQED